MFSRWTMIIHGTLHRLVDTSRLSNSITKTPTFNTNLQDGILNKAKVLKKIYSTYYRLAILRCNNACGLKHVLVKRITITNN